MELTSKKISRKLPEFPHIKNLLTNSFPKNERYPLWLLTARAARRDVDFLAYYDGDDFCGISYSVKAENTLFVLYLAVAENMRSKGYGSAILAEIGRIAGERSITLNVEDPDPSAENAEERRKRVEFYKNNGFFDTGYRLIEKTITHQVMCDRLDFSPRTYIKALRKLSCGAYTPHLEQLFSRTQPPTT